MNRFAVFTLIVAVAFSCTKDIIVKNIKNSTVNVLAPANNTKTSDNAITFWWDALEGADKYNIQIVKPNFTGVQKLVTDTNVKGNKYTQSLLPGTYQWRIKAINGGSSTDYTLLNLIVDTSSGLAGQSVVSLSPLSGFLTRNRNFNFSWSPIASADTYSIEIIVDNVVTGSVTPGTSCTYSFSVSAGAAHTGSWRVKAINGNSISQYNSAQTFSIVLIPPGTPFLSAPSNYAQVKDTVSLVWVRGSGVYSKYDSVNVANDSLFTSSSILRSARVNSNKIKISALNYPASIPSSSVSGLPYYYWRVITVDTVKNVSTPSSVNKFRLL